MESKLKAKELVDKYLKEFLDDSGCGWTEKCASICAKICVQEIIEALNITIGHLSLNSTDWQECTLDFNYWQEVLNHLNEI